jgi:hypothetical protein
MIHTQEDKEQLIDELLFHITITKPLNDIVEGLEQEAFRDCDFDWLITKRLEFTNLAVQAMKKDIPQDFEVDKVEGKMNDRNKEMFLSHFKILQEFFKFN